MEGILLVTKYIFSSLMMKKRRGGEIVKGENDEVK